jgi:hypothetical protein
VPASVTSVQITRHAIDGPQTSPRSVTVTDQGRIFTVIAAFNRIRGEYASFEPFGCASPVGLVYRYAVTFHWPGHTLVADAGEPLCEVGRSLTLDDTKLPQTLQEGHQLVRSLKAAFTGA